MIVIKYFFIRLEGASSHVSGPRINRMTIFDFLAGAWKFKAAALQSQSRRHAHSLPRRRRKIELSREIQKSLHRSARKYCGDFAPVYQQRKYLPGPTTRIRPYLERYQGYCGQLEQTRQRAQ